MSARRELACLKSAMAEPIWPGANAIADKLALGPVKWPEPLECEVRTNTPQMDSQIAQARSEMGEARWSELNGAWNDV